MPEGVLPVEMLRRAVAVYVELAYPGGGMPTVVQSRLSFLDALAPGALVPESCFEADPAGGAGRQGCRNFALRLGQPTYPHMKLVVESCPRGGILFRADAHDAHLHAPADSPEAVPLAALRAQQGADRADRGRLDGGGASDFPRVPPRRAGAPAASQVSGAPGAGVAARGGQRLCIRSQTISAQILAKLFTMLHAYHCAV